eukprot:SAG31_NODE_3560_length_4122_cov_6.095451_1_plen_94_part_10
MSAWAQVRKHRRPRDYKRSTPPRERREERGEKRREEERGERREERGERREERGERRREEEREEERGENAAINGAPEHTNAWKLLSALRSRTKRS